MRVEAADGGAGTQRLDKWLWFARFCKSRTLASTLCKSGRVRVNKEPTDKPNQQVRAGDVLTFPQGNRVRVVKVVALGTRRGPATEAQTLYEDMTPPPPRTSASPAPRSPGTGRPTKRDRRDMDKLRAHEL